MDNPRVSIQIPTYNQRQYIREALDSALAQNFENLQIIIADDCSFQYDIYEYLSDYDDSTKLLIQRNEKNVGRVENYRHTLFNLVKGEWFMNLDGDDNFEKVQFLDFAMQHIANSKDFNIVAFEFNHRLDHIKKHIRWYKELDEETILVRGVDYLLIQKYYQNFMHANTIFNTAAAKKTDFYNQNILTSDFFSAIKIWTQGDIILCSRKIFIWNDHGKNASHTISLADIENEKLAIIDFKKYAAEKLTSYELNNVVNILKYFLFVKVFNIYKFKRKDLKFFRYILFNFKIKKYYFKKLLIELLQWKQSF